MSNIVFQPQPRQIAFMQRAEREAMFGGSAGGGKSYAAIAEATRQVEIPHYRGLILRKTYPQLADLIDISYGMYKSAFNAKYNDSKHCWTFPSGAKIYFGSLQHSQDKTNYQGKSFDFIDFDELTHFTWDEYSYLFSRNRPSGPGTRVYIRSQTNPGGVGHAWVKSRFIDEAPAEHTIWEKSVIHFPDGHNETKWSSRIFVPSSVFDNKALLENDPEYLARLAALPEQEKKALLYGDWNTFAGQVFNLVDNPDGYKSRIATHVIDPFRIPDDWTVYCGFDYGYAKPYAAVYCGCDREGRLYLLREVYGCTGTPNEGTKETPKDIAIRMREVEETDVNLKNRKIIRIADNAIFNDDRGMDASIAAIMEKQGIYFEKSRKDRLSGKMQCHNRFAFDDNGIPMFYTFNTCRDFIRTIPALVYDDKKVEDINTDGEDHYTMLSDIFLCICQ